MHLEKLVKFNTKTRLDQGIFLKIISLRLAVSGLLKYELLKQIFHAALLLEGLNRIIFPECHIFVLWVSGD